MYKLGRRLMIAYSQVGFPMSNNILKDVFNIHVTWSEFLIREVLPASVNKSIPTLLKVFVKLPFIQDDLILACSSFKSSEQVAASFRYVEDTDFALLFALSSQ